MQVRLLTPDDLRAYRDLHRYGLSEAPLAFVETVPDDAERADSTIIEMLARGEAWGLFIGERLLGKLVIDAPPYECLAHTRWLHVVYLHPDARGKGAARQLLNGAIDAARAEGAVRFVLWVNAENTDARRLYERLGFIETGRIPHGIEFSGRRVDDVLMCLAVPDQRAKEGR